jgi:hypothetical protein
MTYYTKSESTKAICQMMSPAVLFLQNKKINLRSNQPHKTNSNNPGRKQTKPIEWQCP